MSKIVNLCKHVVSRQLLDGSIEVIPPSGFEARCSEVVLREWVFMGGKAVKKVFGEVSGLSDPVRRVVYVVSGLVRSAKPERLDLASPGDPVRDSNGVIIGCGSLVFNDEPVSRGCHGEDPEGGDNQAY